MSHQQEQSEQPQQERLSGRLQKQLRHWVGLTLPQFAGMTTESTATHSRREQHDAPLTGATGAVVLVLDYVYRLREGPEQERVEHVRQLLQSDATRRHFLGRFGAGALIQMVQEAGIPLSSLPERIQSWCEEDHRVAVEHAAATQLRQTTGLDAALIGGLITGVVAVLSWAWVSGFFSSPSPKPQQPERTPDDASPLAPRNARRQDHEARVAE